ncbi:amidohydrolase family protein [Blastococcus sp. URHD0036]|uniref:amidohydrolase family protein n=1 Tax=Blastococcus sp. URHD0036 TaxID=1380356 RepID=UPI0004954C3F|nr:amidohydrolase family protein [Blastococcus sp. URHD0036]
MTSVESVEAAQVGKVSDIGLISADSHVNEPRDLWASNLPPSLRSQAMEGIQSGEDGSWKVVFEGQHVYKRDMASEAERLSVLDPEKRFAVMQSEGIVAEAIFPTIGLYVWMLEDAKGGEASCRVYNDWVYDTLQSKSQRFSCAGLIPTWEPEQATREVERIAEMGLRSVMLPSHLAHGPSWNHRAWDPMWDAIDAAGLPVVMHQGTGFDTIWYRGPGATVANLVSTETIGPRTAALLSTSGVLAKHPDLHVVFVEFNTGWLAWVMELMDYYDKVFREYDDIHKAQRSKPTVYPDLEHAPSWYVRNQIHSTFQVDFQGMRSVPLSGHRSLMWGHDYPHEEGTFPHSRRLVDEQAAFVSADEARRIFRENALEIFKFDPAVIDQPF